MTEDEREKIQSLCEEVGVMLPWRNASRKQVSMAKEAILVVSRVFGGSMAIEVALSRLTAIRDELMQIEEAT
jgi:hypothetical protein